MHRIVQQILIATALALPLVESASAITIVPNVVNVYVGYLSTCCGEAPNPADIPTPFDGDLTTTSISIGGSTSSHDTGVIRFENLSSQKITIGGVSATTFPAAGEKVFALWGPNDFTVDPGHNLVLAATTTGFNFDSSDFAPLGANPIVQATINGVVVQFEDVGRALYGHEDIGGTIGSGRETTPYQLIGSAPVPLPGAALMFGSACVWLRSRRRG